MWFWTRTKTYCWTSSTVVIVMVFRIFTDVMFVRSIWRAPNLVQRKVGVCRNMEEPPRSAQTRPTSCYTWLLCWNQNFLFQLSTPWLTFLVLLYDQTWNLEPWQLLELLCFFLYNDYKVLKWIGSKLVWTAPFGFHCPVLGPSCGPVDQLQPDEDHRPGFTAVICGNVSNLFHFDLDQMVKLIDQFKRTEQMWEFMVHDKVWKLREKSQHSDKASSNPKGQRWKN